MNCYSVRVGSFTDKLSLSEGEIAGQPISGPELLNRLAPSAPFSVAGVSAGLWSGPEGSGDRKQVQAASECRDGMELVCTFDAKTLMRGIIENRGNLAVAQQSLWVLSVAAWTARDRVKASNLSILEGVCRLLGEFPEDAAVAELALGAVRSITLDSPENVARLGSAGCSAIFEAVSKFMDNPRVRENGLHALARASSNADNLRGQDGARWVDCALDAGETYSQEAWLPPVACLIVGRVIPVCGKSLPEQRQLDAARCCLKSLSEHRADATAAAACRALGSMAGVPAVRALVVERGGVALLVSILRESEALTDGEEAASAVLRAMVDLFSEQDEKQEFAQRAGAEGAVDLLLQRLTVSMQNANLAENAFHALKFLFLEPQNQLTGGSDALDLIISGLDVHRTNFGVVLYACEALELLMETESVQELVFFTELFDVLVKATQTCLDPSSAATSPVGSRSSSSSSIRLGMPNLPPPPPIYLDSPISEPAIPHAGLPPLPPDAKQLPSPVSNLHVSVVLVAACSAMSAAMGSNFFERARTAGASEVVCTILRKYALFSNVVEHAAWTLSRLAFTTLGQIQLGNLGAVKILFDALEKHKEDAPVLECIVYGISNLTFDPNNSITALSLRAIPVLTDLISAYPASEVIVERACVSLSNVLTVQEDLSVVRECGTIPVIIQVLRDFIESPDVTEQALWALGNMIADDVQNKDAAIAAGIKTSIKAIGKKYADQEDIMIQLRRVKHPVNKVWWVPDLNWLLS